MRFAKELIVVGAIVFIYQGCSPFESGVDGQVGSFSQLSLKCDPTDERNPQSQGLRRLNKNELTNTLNDLFEPYLTQELKGEFHTVLEVALEDVPDQKTPRSEGMNVADQGVSAVHLEGLLKIGSTVSAFIEEKGLGRALVGDCYNPNGSTDSCIRDFIANFGEKALRRALSEQDVDFYFQTYSEEGASFQSLLVTLLSSPFFYYHVEVGNQEVPNQREGLTSLELTAFERANRLSYFLLQSMPDDDLFAVARSQEILKDEVVKAQVNRLLKDPKVQRRLTRSFVAQWLQLDEELSVRDEIPSVAREVASLSVTETAENRIKNMTEEVHDFFYYLIWKQEARFIDIMTSELVFPRTDDLAEIYGTEKWNGDFSVENLVRAPLGERSGVFTRARFLFTGGPSTRPIMRGVSVYRNFLCGQLNLPEDNSNPEGVVIEPEMSEAERVVAATQVPGTSCIGCHQSIINPLGFSFQKFDAFGRFRDVEKIYHPEESAQSGEVLLTKPVDTNETIEIGSYFSGQTNGAVDMAQQMALSAHPNACFTAKVWNFALKDNLAFGSNPCAIQSLYNALTSQDGSVIEVFRNIANQPEFFKRTVQ